MNVEPFSFSHYPVVVEELLLDLFGERSAEPGAEEAVGPAGALAQPFAQWVSGSKAFLAFAQAYRSKIRKKIRTCRNVEEARNLDCELRTAYLLLQTPRFAVAYEPHTKERGRSADLAVTFRTHTTFHVEVTRLRASQHDQQQEPPQEDPHTPPEEAAGAGTDDPAAWLRRYALRRLADVVCDKVGQLAPDTPNVLWVWNESRAVQALEIGQAMQALKRGVELRDPKLYARYGFAKPADFLYNYQRLSAILVHPLAGAGEGSLLWWQNNDARHPLPANIATLLRTRVVADASPPFTHQESEP